MKIVFSFLCALGLSLLAAPALAQDITQPYSASNSYTVKIKAAADQATNVPAGKLCLVRVDGAQPVELACKSPVAPATTFPGNTEVPVTFTLTLAAGETAEVRAYASPPTGAEYSGIGNSELSTNKLTITRFQVPGKPTLRP